jgi:hypothetical protein
MDAEGYAAFSKAGGAGPKSLRQMKRSLEQRIEEHEAKLREHPDAQDAAHWQHEIEVFQDQLRQCERRLGYA